MLNKRLPIMKMLIWGHILKSIHWKQQHKVFPLISGVPTIIGFDVSRWFPKSFPNLNLPIIHVSTQIIIYLSWFPLFRLLFQSSTLQESLQGINDTLVAVCLVSIEFDRLIFQHDLLGKLGTASFWTFCSWKGYIVTGPFKRWSSIIDHNFIHLVQFSAFWTNHVLMKIVKINAQKFPCRIGSLW